MGNSKALGLRKPTHVLLIAISILLTVFILLQLSFKPTLGTHQMSHLNIKSNSESKELVQALKRAAMEDRTVIVTIVDEKWASPGSVLDIFLVSFSIGQGTKTLLDHLLVVTVGSQAFQLCKSKHPHCFQLTTFVPKLAANMQLGVPDYHMLFRKRNNLLLEVLQLGYNFVFTEADVMWLRSPISYIHPTDDITIPCELHSNDSHGGSNKPDSGFFYVRSSEFSIEFFKYWKLDGVLYPNSRAGSLCNEIEIRKEIIEIIGGRINFLNTDHFGGFCQQSKNVSEVYTMHGNCCDSVERKVYDLKLVLDDWINFKAPSSNTSLGVLPWRAPRKCSA